MSRPYTIKFGPWAPDLQNVAVQMQFQWGATEVPCADCSNVYYQDGAYRCLPGASNSATAAAAQILNAFSWYDETAGKILTFAAGADSIYELKDSAWSTLTPSVSTGIFSGTLTVSGPVNGFSGYSSGNYGVLTPDVDTNASVISLLQQDSTGKLQLTIEPEQAQTYFTTLQLVMGSSTISVTASSASFTPAEGSALWEWSGTSPLMSAGDAWAVTLS